MDWLVDYGCSCDAESLAWETMAKAYRDMNFDVVSLRELRDPKWFGRASREKGGQALSGRIGARYGAEA